MTNPKLDLFPMSLETSDLSCPSANEIDRHVGEQIRRLRKQNKLAMVDIAEVIGVTYQQVQKYEKGTNRVSVGMLYRLARCFRVPITAFYDGLDNAQNTAHSAPLAAFSQTNDEAHSLLRLHPSVRSHVEALIMALATKRPVPPKNS